MRFKNEQWNTVDLILEIRKGLWKEDGGGDGGCQVIRKKVLHPRHLDPRSTGPCTIQKVESLKWLKWPESWEGTCASFNFYSKGCNKRPEGLHLHFEISLEDVQGLE
jgi:hypothetical protein